MKQVNVPTYVQAKHTHGKICYYLKTGVYLIVFVHFFSIHIFTDIEKKANKKPEWKPENSPTAMVYMAQQQNWQHIHVTSVQ